ncbi:hypothetical protein [uncultured Duncaniella sp.]|uniref:hypothetical protein n=1 Tax=uncultured Duncaniella sp. TaxID=2768039 RepID=UPI00261386AD|nr:hypothetical protein [uncultured Duncaniella sp.]
MLLVSEIIHMAGLYLCMTTSAIAVCLAFGLVSWAACKRRWSIGGVGVLMTLAFFAFFCVFASEFLSLA